MSIYKGDSLIAGGRQCMPLLSFMWADHQLNDASWLRADTFSWQSGAVYQAAYQHLVDDYTNANYIIADNVAYFRYAAGDTGSVYCWKSQSDVTRFTTSETPVVGGLAYHSSALPAAGDEITDVKLADTETISGITITYYQAPDGHKLVLPNQESNVMAIYNATGVAWYYIIDTINQRFKLPRINADIAKQGYGSIPVKGTGMALGVTDGTNLGGIRGQVWAGSNNALGVNSNLYGQNIGYNPGENQGAGNAYANKALGVTTDATKSGVIADAENQTSVFSGKKYLYFYVGNFTQTALENTAGLNAELFNGKADLSAVAHVVTEFQQPTSANNNTWYRRYADGWVEQGSSNPTSRNTITLPVPMQDANYTLLNAAGGHTGSGADIVIYITAKSATGFTWAPDRSKYINWYVCGYAAA